LSFERIKDLCTSQDFARLLALDLT